MSLIQFGDEYFEPSKIIKVTFTKLTSIILRDSYKMTLLYHHPHYDAIREESSTTMEFKFTSNSAQVLAYNLRTIVDANPHCHTEVSSKELSNELAMYVKLDNT